MIVVAGSLALGTAMMATAAIAFARGGDGGHFGRGFGGDGFYYGDGYSGCNVPTPDGYAWACY